MTQTIEIDCAPFTPRPSEWIGFVLKGSGFKEEDFDTGAPFFGCQVWVLRDPNRENEFIGKEAPVQRTDLGTLSRRAYPLRELVT